MGLLNTDLQAKVILRPIDDPVLSKAIALAIRYALRAADAVQLASCLAVRDALPDVVTTLVCGDGGINRSTVAHGLLTVDPKDASTFASLRVAASRAKT